MTVTKGQLLSTAAAVRHARLRPSEVASLKIDGKDVDAAAAESALAAFQTAADHAEARAQEKKQTPNVFARVSTWAHENVGRPTGEWVREHMPAVAKAVDHAVTTTTAVALTRPEDVDRLAVVEIETHDGRTVAIPVLVRDEKASRLLKATSAAVGGVGLFPFFGNFVQGGTGLAAAIASGVSYLFGDKELGAALLGMAKKHLIMGVVGFVPVVGAATSIQAVADARRLTESDVRVGEICTAPA